MVTLKIITSEGMTSGKYHTGHSFFHQKISQELAIEPKIFEECCCLQLFTIVFM